MRSQHETPRPGEDNEQLKNYAETTLADMDPVDLLSQVKVFRTKVCFDKTKTNLSVKVVANNDAHHQAWNAMRDYMVNVVGAERRMGPAAATGLERDNQRLVDRAEAEIDQRGITLPSIRGNGTA